MKYIEDFIRQLDVFKEQLKKDQFSIQSVQSSLQSAIAKRDEARKDVETAKAQAEQIIKDAKANETMMIGNAQKYLDMAQYKNKVAGELEEKAKATMAEAGAMKGELVALKDSLEAEKKSLQEKQKALREIL